MVTNSDINSITSDSTDSQEVKTEGTDSLDAEVEKTSFEAESLGFDEDYEMLGMRTSHSKTFINDDGNLHEVHSINPLHYENAFGQLIDIDTAILSNEQGYYVEDIFNPVQFNHNPVEGFRMAVGEEIIHSGINPVPVTIYQGITSEPILDGINVPYTNIWGVQDGLFMPPTDLVEVGGSSIKFPMSSTIDLQYHVSSNEVKQEFVLSKLNKGTL